MAGSGSEDQLLIFTLCGQEFGMPLDAVVEIMDHRLPTPVPGANSTIEGILTLRGRMVTLYDGRRQLGLEDRSEDIRPRVVILDDNGELVGLVVDRVIRVADIPGALREPIPSKLALERPELYEGVLRRDEDHILLLNVAALLGGGRPPASGERK